MAVWADRSQVFDGIYGVAASTPGKGLQVVNVDAVHGFRAIYLAEIQSADGTRAPMLAQTLHPRQRVALVGSHPTHPLLAYKERYRSGQARTSGEPIGRKGECGQGPNHGRP
jgi:hypothetical protein